MRNIFVFVVGLFLSFVTYAQDTNKNKKLNNTVPASTQKKTPRDYLIYVRTFADTLLARGLDVYGTKHLPMWTGLIDTRDYSVPELSVANAERTKSGTGYWDVIDRRAVGGANIAHDFETIQAFEILSKLTGDIKYAKAAADYLTAFLENTQNDSTGLLGWGEHMYYEFYKDSVTVGDMGPEHPDYTHEFLDKTPIWQKLWQINPERTARAIRGLRYHFTTPYTQTFLFNRHASWQQIRKKLPPGMAGLEQYQYNHTAAFATHAGRMSYSFMFLHTKTKDPEWLKWAQGVGSLHYIYRDKTTNLTSWTADAYSKVNSIANLSQTKGLAYWLYKTYELDRRQVALKTQAFTLFNAAEKYAWQPEGKFYVNEINVNGVPLKSDDPIFKRQPNAPGDQVRILVDKPRVMADFGRVAAYFYKREKHPHHLVIAQRLIDVMDRDTLPAIFFAAPVSNRIHLLMDVYDITKDRKLLDKVIHYADKGITGLWRGGLFARRVGDSYYESQHNIGSFVTALLRLHMALNGTPKGLENIDWSD
jgi:hypothetical protein